MKPYIILTIMILLSIGIVSATDYQYWRENGQQVWTKLSLQANTPITLYLDTGDTSTTGENIFEVYADSCADLSSWTNIGSSTCTGNNIISSSQGAGYHLNGYAYPTPFNNGAVLRSRIYTSVYSAGSWPGAGFINSLGDPNCNFQFVCAYNMNTNIPWCIQNGCSGQQPFQTDATTISYDNVTIELDTSSNTDQAISVRYFEGANQIHYNTNNPQPVLDGSNLYPAIGTINAGTDITYFDYIAVRKYSTATIQTTCNATQCTITSDTTLTNHQIALPITNTIRLTDTEPTIPTPPTPITYPFSYPVTVYSENFEDGIAQNWTLEGGMQVSSDTPISGTYSFYIPPYTGGSNSYLPIPDMSNEIFSVSYQAKTSTSLFLALLNGPYTNWLQNCGIITAENRIRCTLLSSEVDINNFTVQDIVYTITYVVDGPNAKYDVYINGERYLTAADLRYMPLPIDHIGAGFWNSGSTGRIDNIIIQKAGNAPCPELPTGYLFYDNAECGSIEDKWQPWDEGAALEYNTNYYYSGTHSIGTPNTFPYGWIYAEFPIVNTSKNVTLSFKLYVDNSFDGNSIELGFDHTFGVYNGQVYINSEIEPVMNLTNGWHSVTALLNTQNSKLIIDNTTIKENMTHSWYDNPSNAYFIFLDTNNAGPVYIDDVAIYYTPTIPGTIKESSSPGKTRYLVDAQGNIVGTQYGNQIISQPSQQGQFLSIGGQGAGFDLWQWIKDLWNKITGGK